MFKINVIATVAERKQRPLLGEACLAACSREWGQQCRITFLLNVFCLCSRQIQRRSFCTGKRSGENGVDCTGKLVLENTVVRNENE